MAFTIRERTSCWSYFTFENSIHFRFCVIRCASLLKLAICVYHIGMEVSLIHFSFFFALKLMSEQRKWWKYTPIMSNKPSKVVKVLSRMVCSTLNQWPVIMLLNFISLYFGWIWTDITVPSPAYICDGSVTILSSILYPRLQWNWNEKKKKR